MAYDPNDPADKAIVAGLVATALEEQESIHESAIEGLKNKNKDLITKLNKARAGNDGGSNDEILRLENELDASQTKLAETERALNTTKRDLTRVTGERDTANTNLATESEYSRSMVVENDLTSALVEAKVAPEFMDAAKALLSKGVAVKVDGDKRTAFVGDKSLGDVVKEWSASDKGKAFIKAPENGGGHSTDKNPQGEGSAKRISEMNQAERIAHHGAIGDTKFNEQVAFEQNNPKT